MTLEELLGLPRLYARKEKTRYGVVVWLYHRAYADGTFDVSGWWLDGRSTPRVTAAGAFGLMPSTEFNVRRAPEEVLDCWIGG